ncbi:MAG: hypothetical protein ACE5E0_05385, partial [Terriglobia bacterium]
SSVQTLNFPPGVDLGLDSTDQDVEVIIYYVDQTDDLKAALAAAEQADLPKENRLILVYKKGRKDGVNRDSIIGPFRSGEITGYRLKAPMLCSISSDLSACVLSRDK